MEAYYLSHIASTVLGTMNRVNATHTTRESIYAEILQVGEPRLELPEPEVAGVVNGVMPPDRDGTTLTVFYLDTHPGDVVTYCWVGSKTGTVCDSITLNSFTAGKPIQFTIGAGLIKNNKGGMVEAKYSIKLAAGGTSYSNPLTFRVGVALELKAPAIEQAPNGSTLDPFAAEDALTAIINYDMRIGDKITVTLTGAPGTPAGGSHTTAPVNVTTIGAQNIEIDTSVLAFNFGKSVSVHCTVSRDGESKDSEVLVLAVLPIQDQDSRLPSPIINGNTSSELDTNTLARGAKTRIARWSHNAQGQPLWLLYLKDDDPTPFAITYEATPTPAAGLPNVMYPDTPVAALKALPNGARVRIEFRVGFDRSSDESKAVTFPVRNYTVKAKVWVTPTLNNVLDDKGVEVPEGQATLSTTLKLKGTATKGEKVELYDGNGPSAALKGNADVDPVTGKWEYTITVAPAGSRRLYAKALYPVSQLYSNVRTLADGTRENFDELDDLDIPPSTSLEFRNFVLENTTNGIITIRKVSSPFPGQVERKTLSASGTGPFSLHLKSKGIKVSFWYTSLHKKEQVTVRFLGPRLNMFHFLDPYTWGKAEHFSFHAFEPATEISRIEIWMKRDEVMHFDNFQFSLP